MKKALVVEGGGQRGIFTAGVLDAFMMRGYNPFDLYIGTSAGAQNITTYLSKQHGLAYKIISELTTSKCFFDISSIFKCRDLMDLKWLFDQSKKGSKYFVDVEKAFKNSIDKEVYFAATDVNTHTTSLLEPNEENWFSYLTATSAIPGLVKGAVCNGDQCLVNGGVTSPIPIKEAIELGATDITVITTVPKRENESLLDQACRLVTSKNEKLVTMMCEHVNNFNATLDLFNNASNGVNINKIEPIQKLSSHTIMSTKEALLKDYRLGFYLGLRH